VIYQSYQVVRFKTVLIAQSIALYYCVAGTFSNIPFLISSI